MEPISPWWAILVTACSSWLSYHLGYRQGIIAKKSLDLSITKATPKIGTTLKIDKRQERSPAFPPYYYLIASIYNEGELAAKQLNGRCKLHSALNYVSDKEVPISREFLGPTPYELERFRLDGTTVDVAMIGSQEMFFDVDIDFDYVAIPDDKPLHYQAKYQYDNKSHQMIKVG